MKKITAKSPAGKLILLSTVLASGMAFLSGTVVSIALPSIQAGFNASISEIQWIVNAYVLALAVLILISGSLGDHFGRKRIFLLGIGLFGFGSLLSALAQSTFQLITFQGLQGIGAAMMIPGSLAIIHSCFKQEVQGKVIGLWAGLSGGLAAFGPLLGGWLVETFGWPSVFWINVPLAALVFFTAVSSVPESKNPEKARLDFPGITSVGVALFGLAFSLIQGPTRGWDDNLIIGGIALAISGAIAFVLIELRAKYPIVPFKVFKDHMVWGANAVTFVLYFALNGAIFFLVLNFQQIQNYSPIEAGLALLPPTLLIAFFSGPAGSLADRIGPRMQMVAGPFIVGVGMFLFAASGEDTSYIKDFLPGMILFGGGMALTIAPLTKSALTVKDKYSGVASGVNNAVSRIAALIAIALLGAVILTVFQVQLENQISQAELSTEERGQILAQKDKLGGITIPKEFGEEKALVARQIVEGSFVSGFQQAMIISGVLAFLASLISFFTIKRPVKHTEHTKHLHIMHHH